MGGQLLVEWRPNVAEKSRSGSLDCQAVSRKEAERRMEDSRQPKKRGRQLDLHGHRVQVGGLGPM